MESGEMEDDGGRTCSARAFGLDGFRRCRPIGLCQMHKRPMASIVLISEFPSNGPQDPPLRSDGPVKPTLCRVPVEQPPRSAPSIRRPCKPSPLSSILCCLTGRDDGGNQAGGRGRDNDLQVGVLHLDARGSDNGHPSLLGLNQDVLPWASLAITIALVFVLVIVFEVIDGAIGGASSTPPPQRRSTRISRGRWTGTCQVE
ncbi:hypothetical protein CDL15_Pgr003311 [Punica granatum]|uniref:Uncharacterized protein n=1 Tax=Punica granatum TaxID=22663 RepID=A0A218X382_PUNGR|nr:hypothetical protein CDL15_Pgr003311 [Punica granatum]